MFRYGKKIAFVVALILTDSNPYAAPNHSASNHSEPKQFPPSQRSLFEYLIRAGLAGGLGFLSNCAVCTYISPFNFTFFSSVFFATAILFALTSVYLIMRQGALWGTYAMFFVLSTLMLLVQTPSFVDGAKLIAGQSLIQMLWTVLLTPQDGPRENQPD